MSLDHRATESASAVIGQPAAEDAARRIAEIDAEFEAATHWGSWMVMLANEREDLAKRFGFPHKWQARCGGRRTD